MPGELDGKDLLFIIRYEGENAPIIVVSCRVDDEAAEHQPDCFYAVIKNLSEPTAFDKVTRSAFE